MTFDLLCSQILNEGIRFSKTGIVCYVLVSHLNGMYSTALIHSSGSEALAINSKSLTN
jgi:hypothetical protein